MPRIVIDPGHGGSRPAGTSSPFGSVGPEGTLEKDVTLRLARKVRARFGADAVLTRDADVNLSLADRLPQQ
jgi:N-acetylmuramoyl-L-alanine amidase